MFPSFVDFSFLLLCFFLLFFMLLCCVFCCSLSLIFLIGISMPAFMCAQAHVGSWLDGNFIYSFFCTVLSSNFHWSRLGCSEQSEISQWLIESRRVTHNCVPFSSPGACRSMMNSASRIYQSCKTTNDDDERRNQRRIITITTIPSQSFQPKKYIWREEKFRNIPKHRARSLLAGLVQKK